MHDVALGGAVLRVAGRHRQQRLVGSAPGFAGHGRDDLDVVGAHDLVPVHLVHVYPVCGLDDDPVAVAQPVDVVERPPVGRAVPGDGEVADLPRPSGAHVVAEAQREHRVGRCPRAAAGRSRRRSRGMRTMANAPSSPTAVGVPSGADGGGGRLGAAEVLGQRLRRCRPGRGWRRRRSTTAARRRRAGAEHRAVTSDVAGPADGPADCTASSGHGGVLRHDRSRVGGEGLFWTGSSRRSRGRRRSTYCR